MEFRFAFPVLFLRASMLKPMTILMASSLILSPREEAGGTFSHAPDSTEPAASSLALHSTSLHDVRMVSNSMSTLSLSQSFWLLVEVTTGISGGKSCFHTEMLRDELVAGVALVNGLHQLRPKREWLHDGMPRPPDHTGRVA